MNENTLFHGISVYISGDPDKKVNIKEKLDRPFSSTLINEYCSIMIIKMLFSYRFL